MIELKIFSENLFEWILLSLFIIGLTYAAFKIKNEPNEYLQKASYLSIGPFSLLIPSWWSLTQKEDEILSFKRADTHYAWRATFFLKKIMTNSSRKSLLNELISERKIVFDPEFKEHHYSYLNSSNQKVFISRHEGMATKDETERSYADITVIEIPDEKVYLIGISLSSILNGCVEGPYFEEVINRVVLA